MRLGGRLLALLLLPCWGLLSAQAEHGMYEPRFREGSAGDVLVAGEPSLLRGHLDAFVDLTQAAFDLALWAPLEQEVRDGLELAFTSWKAPERQAFLDLVRPVASLRAKGRSGDTDGLKAGLRSFWIELDRRIQAAPREAAHRALTTALERRLRAVWPGVPPIQGSAAEAWLSATVLLVGLARNESYEPTVGQQETLRAQLDTELRGQPEALRERLRVFHRSWLLLQARWDAAPPAARFRLRWEALQLLARMCPAAQGFTPTLGPDPADYAREAAKVAARLTPYDAWSNLARQPAAVLEALTKGLDLPAAPPEHILLYR